MRPSRRRRRLSTWFWITLIGVLFMLDAGLVYIWLRGLPAPADAPQPTSLASVVHNAAQPTPRTTPLVSRQPQRTALARLGTPTRGPTRTPRPRPAIIPSPTGPRPASTPANESARCQDVPGRIVDESHVSQITGAAQPYIVYLPPCYDVTDRRYPVIYLIHGAYRDDTHWENLGIFAAMDQGVREGRLAPAIIVLPSGDEDLFTYTNGGAESFEGQIAQELVPVVDDHFRTDARPPMRAIGGISRGGVWSLEIGFNSQTFGVVAGHSACLNLNESPPEYDPLQMARLPALTTLRIWLDSGDQDDCLPGVEDMHAALQAADVPHYYRIYPGVHEDALWAAHLDEYLEFYTATWPRR